MKAGTCFGKIPSCALRKELVLYSTEFDHADPYPAAFVVHCLASVREDRFEWFRRRGPVGSGFIRQPGVPVFPPMTRLDQLFSPAAAVAAVSRAIPAANGSVPSFNP